jgi:hypothetical protein
VCEVPHTSSMQCAACRHDAEPLPSATARAMFHIRHYANRCSKPRTVQALADPAVRSRLADFGLEIVPRERQTPEVLGALVKADAKKWWPVIKEFGINAG